MTPAETSPEYDPAAAREAIASMEAQLVALYEEKLQAPTREALLAMVESLDAQVCALLDAQAERGAAAPAAPASA